MIMTADVAVIGAGVAGLTLANALCDLGLGVALVEAEPEFRDRIRGEALHPWGAAEAAKLGLIETLRRADGHELPVWRRYADQEVVSDYDWRDDVPEGHVEWSVSHPALQDHLLAAVADRLICLLRPTRFTALRQTDHRIEVDVVAGDVRTTIVARLVVGADGQRSAVRRALGVTARRDQVHHKLGGVLLAGVDLAPGKTHQAFFPGGMTVVFPRSKGRARVYLACAPDQAATLQGPASLPDFIATAAAPLPEGALARATAAGPSGFFPGADIIPERLSGGRVVLVGDAAGANDPAQGHGLSLSFRDARELRDLLADGDDWPAAIAEFARRRSAYLAPLRAHARWAGQLLIDTGPEADRRRDLVARARELDPTAGGYAGIHAFGPDGLDVSETARRHFFGEDLPEADRP